MVRGLIIITFAFLAGFVASAAPLAIAQSPKQEIADSWSKAQAEAEAKIEAHLKAIDPKMRYAEFKSERLRRHLPDYRLFVGLERNTFGEPSLFLVNVNQGAEITDLDDDDLAGISTFLRARKIQVKTPEAAIEFVKLVEELNFAQGYIADFYRNTKAFAVFDTCCGRSEDWKYGSEKREGGWKVTIRWGGDLATSIVIPPLYEIDVDDEGIF